MLNFGQIYITSDTNIVTQSIYNDARIIVLDEQNPFPNYPNVYMASLLVPPYSILEKIIDGDIQTAEAMYIDYLTSHEVNSFIAIILFALYRGENIVLYINSDEVGFKDMLLRYICNVYGIIIGSEFVKCQYNEAGLMNILISLYMNRLISASVFLFNLGPYVIIPDFVIIQLITDIDPNRLCMGPNECKAFINSYRLNMANANKPLVKPLQRL